jgi:hypothetical protein
MIKTMCFEYSREKELCREIINQRSNELLLHNNYEITIESPPETFYCNMDNESPTKCPVNACPFNTIKRPNMRAHFRNRHNKDRIVIEEEGMLPKCPNCGIQQLNVGSKHIASATCIKYSMIRNERLSDMKNKIEIAETTFYIQGKEIETVHEFKYLGRMITSSDCDWSAVNYNLKKARAAWGRLAKILSSEKAEAKAMATIYRAVIQAVLLYGAESWAMTNTMVKRLQSFHNRCARYITGQHIRQNADETWTCPPTKEVLERAGLLPIQEYVTKRRSTIKVYSENLEIYKKCIVSRPLPSNPKQQVWWNLT